MERLAGLSDGQTMLCVAGDFNAHIGVVEPADEETIRRFGWGTRSTQHKSVVFELRMKKWKDKRTMGPKNIKWWKCKDEMMVEYREGVRRKYEELDAEKRTVERVNGGSTRMHSLGWRRSCVAERRGKEVHREAEPKDSGRKRWREGSGEKREAWKMIECIKYRGEQPPTSLTCMARTRRQPGGRWTEHGGVWRKNCTESLTKMLAKI